MQRRIVLKSLNDGRMRRSRNTCQRSDKKKTHRPGTHAISGTNPSFNRPLSRKTRLFRDKPPLQSTLHPEKHPFFGTTRGNFVLAAPKQEGWGRDLLGRGRDEISSLRSDFSYLSGSNQQRQVRPDRPLLVRAQIGSKASFRPPGPKPKVPHLAVRHLPC